MENKVLRMQFELTELRISVSSVVKKTTNAAAPKRPMQKWAGGAGCGGCGRLLVFSEYFKSGFHKHAAFLISKAAPPHPATLEEDLAPEEPVTKLL